MARTVFKLGTGVFGLVLAMVMVVGLASPSFASAYMRPTVTHVIPASGSSLGGKTVTITGKNYTGYGKSLVKTVWFGGTWKGTNIHVLANGLLTVTSPRGAGTVKVRVATVAGLSLVNSASVYSFVAAPVSAAPVVSSVSPSSGSTLGGTSVTITGSNLLGATGVMFGTTPALFTTSTDGTSITAQAPAGTAGMVNITVTTPAGTSAVVSADQFTYVTNAAVSSLSPSTGPAVGGTSVTLTGTSFTGATKVMFGQTAATSFTVNSDTSITAVAPAGTTGAIVDVTVTTPIGTSAKSASDEYTYSGPAVTGVSTTAPDLAAGGNTVTITGTGFTGVTKVMFGTKAATIVSGSDTSLTVMSPAGTGTVDVTVTTASGTSVTSPADHYVYAPVITSLSPTGGTPAGGTTVTITGSGFTGASAVKFGTSSANFTVSSDTTILATAPIGTGAVNVTVTTPAGTSASTAIYTYGTTVTGVSPNNGPLAGGNNVTITGSGFTGITSASAVMFGGSPAASIFVVSDTTILAKAPAGTGTVNVVVTGTAGASAVTSADKYTYAPVVSSVTGSNNNPLAGGNTVTISGTGFTGATSVMFGTAAATSVTVVSDTSITAVAPAGTGTVDVTVTTPAGTSVVSSNDHYTYNAAVTVSLVNPNTGGLVAGGTVVTLTGTGFTGATAVKFGSTAATSFIVQNATSITAMAPAGSGTVDVTVTTPAGTSATSSSDTFTYAPVVSAVSPNNGLVTGGTVVTITGSGFTGATSVKFGTNAATSFVVASDNTIYAVASAGTAGTVDVTVTTPSGTSATTSADEFTYNPAPVLPTVSGLSPATGPSTGGTFLTISGSAFTGATKVMFGTTPASSFFVSNDSTILAIAPAGTGAVNVTVTTPAGTSTSTATYTYTVAPTVTVVSPNSGTPAGGTGVTITGTGFTNATAVNFGSTAATGVTVVNSTSITATAPAGAGTVDVTVVAPSGTSATSSADHFTYKTTVISLSADHGAAAGGNSVTITGTGFLGATSVMFGTHAATITGTPTDTSITATVPAGTGMVDVTVTTPNGGTSAVVTADEYTYGPVVSGISPSVGPALGGTFVTISGSGFTGATAVTFGGTAASYVVMNDTTISATAPVGTVPANVVVTGAMGDLSAPSAADVFTYAPAITGLSSTSGTIAGGNSVTITGTGFTGSTTVMFGTNAATVTNWTTTTLTVTVPAGTAGAVNVTASNAAGTSPAATYTYTTP